MVQVRGHKANAKGKNRGRGSSVLKSVFKTMAARLKGGVRTCKEEPLPPTTPGTYCRTVSSVDGSIEYVKVGSQVSNPARTTTFCMIGLPPSSA